MNWAEHCAAVEAGEPGFPVVEIIWDDAVAVAPNWEEEVSAALRKITTVGYLIDETDDAVLIMSMINPMHVGHGISIPKGCIRERRIKRD